MNLRVLNQSKESRAAKSTASNERLGHESTDLARGKAILQIHSPVQFLLPQALADGIPLHAIVAGHLLDVRALWPRPSSARAAADTKILVELHHSRTDAFDRR